MSTKEQKNSTQKKNKNTPGRLLQMYFSILTIKFISFYFLTVTLVKDSSQYNGAGVF